MLLSPATLHSRLKAIISTVPTGAHTALLSTPQGQIISWASVHGQIDRNSRDDAQVDGEGSSEGDDDEPWLDEPERLRLLLGLLSQWQEDASPRIECELGRLYLKSIHLPEPDSTPSSALLPAIRPERVTRFVLLVNGTTQAPWPDLAAQSEKFVLPIRN